MDLWPKQTGNVAGCKLHGKLAAESEAACLDHGAICLFWAGSPALVLCWLYNRMTLLYRRRKQQLTQTAAPVPSPVIADGAQLLRGIQPYLLVTWVSWCSCSCGCQCLCWAAETNRNYSSWCSSMWEVAEMNSLCQFSIFGTLLLHPGLVSSLGCSWLWLGGGKQQSS